MPREILQLNQMPQPYGIRTSGWPYEPAVGWGRDGGVQIGVVAKGWVSLFWLLTGCIGDDSDTVDASLRLLGVALIEKFPGLAGEVLSEAEKDARSVEVGREVLNLLDVAANPVGFPEITGVWAELDRRQINDLIRMLRKARDAAFGRDE